ncbi:MAG TPA: hypothetical protein VFQ38_09050, partial [Longimicrobiales bacterium]|nr:hypothetical protein [Longimicrobiales bacterium]
AVLAPTVLSLQTAAFALLDAMIAVGKTEVTPRVPLPSVLPGEPLSGEPLSGAGAPTTPGDPEETTTDA